MAFIGTGDPLPENTQSQSSATKIRILVGGNYFFNEKYLYEMASLLGGLKISQLTTDE